VQFILSSLQDAGFEAFVVGGCVRDAIRGVPPKDWDVATSATPSQTKALFARSVDTGIKHGTITVLLGGNGYEVTTYRIDGVYLDSRRPESVTFSTKIDEDLSRRDFTMNAIAYNPTNGFVDPFNGRDDIAKKVIRCVGNPTCRFNEDALRMLRAIRFAGVLGFTVDESALAAISKLRENLSHISAERIREELGKLLCSAYPQSLMLLEDTGLMPYVLRGHEYKGDLRAVIPQLAACPPDESMRLALFLSPSPKGTISPTTANLLRDLRYDNKTIKEATLYVEMLQKPLPNSRYEIKKLLRVVGQESLEKLLDLKAISSTKSKPKSPKIQETVESVRKEVQDIIANKECFTLRDLAVNGDDLAKAGIPPGKATGDTLEALLDVVMRNPSVNEKEILTSSSRYVSGIFYPNPTMTSAPSGFSPARLT